MYESESAGMQCLTWTYVETVENELTVSPRGGALEYLVATIALVIEERMPNVFHVYAYLMGASCLEDTLYEGDIAYAFEHPVVSDGVLAYCGVGEDGHLQSVVWVSGYLAAYGACFFLK